MPATTRTTTRPRLDADEREQRGDSASGSDRQTGSMQQLTSVRFEQRNRALQEFMDDWIAESGPPDPAGVAKMTERYLSNL